MILLLETGTGNYLKSLQHGEYPLDALPYTYKMGWPAM